jgi:hypothetical protein
VSDLEKKDWKLYHWERKDGEDDPKQGNAVRRKVEERLPCWKNVLSKDLDASDL